MRASCGRVLTGLLVLLMLGGGDVGAREGGAGKGDAGGEEPGEDRHVSEEEALGRKVMALREAIADPDRPGAMKAVTELGHDQRYYVMVRGWLDYQLRADLSVLEAAGEKAAPAVRARVAFLRRAIRAVDLE